MSRRKPRAKTCGEEAREEYYAEQPSEEDILAELAEQEKEDREEITKEG